MKYFKWILIAILFWSCQNNNNSKATLGRLLNLNVDTLHNQKIDIASLFDSVEFIPIDKKVIIGEIDLLTFKNDSLFLLGDTKYTKSLILINNKGQIINSFNYAGKGPNEGLYLRDIIYDHKNSKFVALISNNEKLLFFNDSLQSQSVIPLSNNYFRLTTNFDDCYAYDHDDQILCELNLNDFKETKIKSFEEEKVINFYPTPVFYKGINNQVYFNIPYAPVIYKLSNGVITPFIKLTCDITSNAKNDNLFIKNYPPVVTNIIETKDMFVIFYSYKFLNKAAIYSKDKQLFTSAGNIYDKLGLMKEFYPIDCNNRIAYGTMNANDFLSFCNNYKNTINQENFPKMIFNNIMGKIGINNNPILVKYYLKESIRNEK